MTEETTSSASAAASESGATPGSAEAPDLVAWPPPGLERLQGDLWGAVDRLAVGSFVFALPLLAALTLPQDPWRLGIFGDAWWIVLFTTAVGVWVLLAGHVHLFRALRRWRRGVRSGYTPRTVALVLYDRPGDTGFLVQGGRAYSLLDEGRRRGLLTGRLAQMALLLGAALWLHAGFVTGVLLAARGVLDEGGLVGWTLLPVALAVVGSVVLKAWENGELGKARKRWHAQGWSEDLALSEIEGWHAALGRRPGSVGVLPGKPRSGGGVLRIAAAGTVVVAVGTLVVAASLVVFSAVGPVLSFIAVPRFSATAEKAARAEALRTLRPPLDASITPTQAGEAFASLSGPGGEDVLREPPRSHERIFPGDEDTENPTGLRPELWARELVPRLAEGLDAEVVRYLVAKGEHPALAELGVLARASTMDEIGVRYVTPFPEDLSIWALPIPRYSPIREAAYAQIGAAVGDAASGRFEAAENRLREVIGAGLLLGDDGSTLIANLIGYVVAGLGAEALANLYDATGRPAEAERLRQAQASTQRAAALTSAALGRLDMSDLPEVAADTTVIRGIRWEFLTIVQGIGPCLNLNRVFFGLPEDHDAWLSRVEARLPRTEGERALFELARRGFRPELDEEPPPLVARVMGQVVGGGTGFCAELAAEVN